MSLTYRLDVDAAAIAAHFAARAGDDIWSGGAIAPGGFAPVITTGREFVAGPRPGSDGDPPRRLIPRLWGVPPPPSAIDARGGVLTVRNPSSPFWIGNLRNSEFRCLIPATSFGVWGRGVDREGKRCRLSVILADQPLFAFAGVWKDSEVPSFAILMTAPNAALRAEGRDAMPAILPGTSSAWRIWLNGGWDRASALIAPYGSSLMAIADGR